MRCLVVKAHPLAQSLCSELTTRIVARLEEDGHQVTLEDLHAQGFAAEMNEDERRTYYAGPYQTQDVTAQVERLLAAQALVLVFPTWWFSFPAQLKGWFDRVWAPGVTYDHSPGFGPITPRLTGLRHMLAVTTLGSTWWVDRLVLRSPVRRVLKTALLGACAPQCRFHMCSLYKSEHLSQHQIDAFWSRVRTVLRQW